MAKDKKSVEKSLSALMDKALRRSEKLEKTLAKIVARSDVMSSSEELLRAVRHGMAALRREDKLKASRPKPDVKPAPDAVGGKAPRPVKRVRKTAPAHGSTEPVSEAMQVADSGAE